MQKNKEKAKGGAGNQLAAAIILADPTRHLAWQAPLSVAEVEASLMVRWARRIVEVETKTEQVLS